MKIHATLNLETLRLQHVEAIKFNAYGTLRLLKKTKNAYPNKRSIHVFLDNARYHHARALKLWLSEKNTLSTSLRTAPELNRTAVGRHAQACHL
ncbi:MAG: hypothetical protein COA91_07480 [Robiginitomaculum sp.]|nr:MAG: hypothetical protein COA91_07480 [Robiginitomaculum sp.]